MVLEKEKQSYKVPCSQLHFFFFVIEVSSNNRGLLSRRYHTSYRLDLFET